jgi:hypothetical protein
MSSTRYPPSVGYPLSVRGLFHAQLDRRVCADLRANGSWWPQQGEGSS